MRTFIISLKNRKLNKLFTLSLIYIFLFLIPFKHSLAYVDPGTGAFIIQSFVAIIGAIFFYLGYPIRVIRGIFHKYFNKKNKKK